MIKTFRDDIDTGGGGRGNSIVRKSNLKRDIEFSRGFARSLF